jgi:competence protein ComGC
MRIEVDYGKVRMVENQVEEYYLEQAEADNRMDKKPII